MENIFRSWTEFSKRQSKTLRGPLASGFVKLAEESANEWGTKPYPRGEAWKYVNFRELPQTHFRWPEEDGVTTQVADPNFYTFEVRNFVTPQPLNVAELPPGVRVQSEVTAEQPITRALSDNPFEVMATSFYGLGLQIDIDSGVQLKKPIKIIIDLDKLSGKDLFIHQNISIGMKEKSAAQVFLEIRGEAFCGLANICLNCELGAAADLKVFSKEKGGPQSHFVVNLQSTVGESANFSCHDITLPSQWTRHNFSVDLREKASMGSLYGAYLNDKKNFSDHHTSIRHSVGATESREDYRGILSGQAQAVFNGKVYIAANAAKSNSEQINKNLMLSSDAEIDTKPELQIYNDDVKAAHGATVGQLDEEQKFYLQSRGYTAERASQILSKAFVYGLFDRESEQVQDFYGSDVANSLDRLGAH